MQTLLLLGVAFLALGGTKPPTQATPPPKPPPGSDVGSVVQGFVTGALNAWEQYEKNQKA